ncbi:hypothetical protein DEJ28_12085 [Curtobacterium sp. MCPF17_002]|uniref:hypothetical protein n=1 Tax=Curtobacterium sp. MCPF17_002 TaxID=2175645 RepID=UPI000DAA3E33|nr:hypothetical protein [Curtobacterium sp. MCPF17_002]WIB76403.1 hypothetical protein DEJ28_12085 [Curtobacterium sp. MCPF17_002]
MTSDARPTSREEALRLRADEGLPLVLFDDDRNRVDAVVVDQLDDGSIAVWSTGERASVEEDSTRMYSADNESAALDDALDRARASRRVHDISRRRQEEAIAAWRARGDDAWVHGESGLWLKGVHHSAGPRWQVFRRQEDWGSGAGSLGYIRQTPDGYVAMPPIGFLSDVYRTCADAEQALLAAAEPRTE